MMRFLRPLLIAAALLGAAVFLMGAAWTTQGRAADRLLEAERINSATIPESNAVPPPKEVNLGIIDNLEQAVEVRTIIDGSLGEILEVLSSLKEQQESSRDLALGTRADLDALADSLARAVVAAEGSSAELDTSNESLRTSRRLAWLIAEELEELDRNSGPGSP